VDGKELKERLSLKAIFSKKLNQLIQDNGKAKIDVAQAYTTSEGVVLL
jgi:hypothetical protein